MYLNMGENMVANGEHEKISIGRVLVSVSTPLCTVGGAGLSWCVARVRQKKKMCRFGLWKANHFEEQEWHTS